MPHRQNRRYRITFNAPRNSPSKSPANPASFAIAYHLAAANHLLITDH